MVRGWLARAIYLSLLLDDRIIFIDLAIIISHKTKKLALSQDLFPFNHNLFYFVTFHSSLCVKMENNVESESDDDSSSTEGELDLLKEKLAALEAVAGKHLQLNKPTSVFHCPSTSSDESSVESVMSVDVEHGDADSFEKTFGSSTNSKVVRDIAAVDNCLPTNHHPSKTNPLYETSEAAAVTCKATKPEDSSRTTVPMRAPFESEQEQKTHQSVRSNPVVDREMPPIKEPTTSDDISSSSSDSSSSTTSSGSSSSSSTSSSRSSDSDDDSSEDERSSTGSSKGDVPSRHQTKPSDARMSRSRQANPITKNPYAATSSREPLRKPPEKPQAISVPVAMDQPQDNDSSSVAARTKDPDQKEAPRAPEPDLDLDDYFLFFGDDYDDEVQATASPHFARATPPAEEKGSRTIEAPPSSGSSPISLKRSSEAMKDALEAPPTTARPPTPQKGPANHPEDIYGRDDPLPVYNQRAALTSDQNPEIHFSLYSPPVYQPRASPVQHKFNQANRPKLSRREIPISQMFQPPISMFWHGRFQKFNALQSELADPICHSDDHIVVSAPTGAGKTAIFEMAMARFIAADLAHASAYSHGTKRLSRHRKMVYFAPSKALCEERLHDWTKRLAMLNLGIEVTMITGDTIDPGTCYNDLSSAHLILTTPEKWDSISRRWTENFFLMASVKLLMIDEVHLLGDSSRGHCLEAIISRMKSIQRAALNSNASENQIQSSRYVGTTWHYVSNALSTLSLPFEPGLVATLTRLQSPLHPLCEPSLSRQLYPTSKM